jgi:glyoxylase-like metal-dependent hydrolase (beta-lactamase superfamily II)
MIKFLSGIFFMQEIIPGVFLFLGQGYNCNCYVITNNNEALIIDAGLGDYGSNWGFNVSQQSELEGLLFKFDHINQICLTHAHLDHTGGIMSLEDDLRKKIKILSHEKEANQLEEPNLEYIDPLTRSRNIRPIIIDKKLKNGEKIIIGNLQLEVLHTPGHTEGSMCLWESEKKILFSGDTIFPEGSFGRVDFPGSNSMDLITSLESISSLEISSLLAGHMAPDLSIEVKENVVASYKIAKKMFE